MDRGKLILERASRLILKEADADFDLEDLENDNESIDNESIDDIENDLEEESVEIDVTDLVDSIEEVNRTMLGVIQVMEDMTEVYLNNFIDIKNKIHTKSEEITQMTAQQTSELTDQLKKRIPTKEERTESLMPKNTMITPSNTSQSSNDQSQYILRKDDIDDYNDFDIRNSL